MKKTVGWIVFLSGSLWILAFLAVGGLSTAMYFINPSLIGSMPYTWFGIALLGAIPIYFGMKMWRRV